MIRKLHPDQVWDVSRSCFFPTIDLADPKQFVQGEPVMVANKSTANEFKFIVVERS